MGDPTGGCGGRVCIRSPFCRMILRTWISPDLTIDRYALLSHTLGWIGWILLLSARNEFVPGLLICTQVFGIKAISVHSSSVNS